MARQSEPDHRDPVPGPELIRARVGHDLPVIQDDDPVRQALGLIQVVGGQQHGGAPGGQLLDDRPQPAPGLRVQAGGRLVQEQQLGPADDPQAIAGPGAAPAGPAPASTAVTSASSGAATPDPGLLAASLGLTPREGQVLTLIADGLSNSEIARRLVVSEATVKSHVNHLLAKIGARSRAQAVSTAFQHGRAARDQA